MRKSKYFFNKFLIYFVLNRKPNEVNNDEMLFSSENLSTFVPISVHMCNTTTFDHT